MTKWMRLKTATHNNEINPEIERGKKEVGKRKEKTNQNGALSSTDADLEFNFVMKWIIPLKYKYNHKYCRIYSILYSSIYNYFFRTYAKHLFSNLDV